MWTEIAMFGNSSKKDNLGKWAKSQLQNVHDCIQLCPTLCGPWTAAHQVPLSMEFNKRILEQLAISCSRFFFFFPTQGQNPHLLCLLHHRWILYHCTIWEAQQNVHPSGKLISLLLPLTAGRQSTYSCFFRNFLFYIGVQLSINVVIPSGARQTDPATHPHVSIPPQTPFLTRPPHNAEQTSLESTFFCASQSIHSELSPYFFFLL